jgi:hypothetical protein
MNPAHLATPCRGLATAACDDFLPAGVTAQYLNASDRERLRLEKRRLSIMKARWAKPMAFLGAAHRRLRAIGNSPLPGVCRFVVFSLCIPVFKLHNFCFQHAYDLGIRLHLLNSFEHGELNGDELPSYLRLSRSDFPISDNSIEALERLNSRLKAAIRDADRNIHNSSLQIDELRASRALAAESRS